MFWRGGWLLLVSGLFLAGCALLAPANGEEPAVVEPAGTTVWEAIWATATPAPPTPTIEPDSGWEELRPGLERRIINLHNEQNLVVETLYILRLEPEQFRFDVVYDPLEPKGLARWQEETGALAVINGGYFMENYVATGRIISGGQASGVSYGEFAGMFVVTEAGPELRWLQEQPYDPDEPLWAGLQSFPLLVKPGRVPGFPEEDLRPARRTVLGQDNEGRLIFLVASLGYFTLHDLSYFLTESDLDLHIALNLDGGASSGILLAEPAEGIHNFAAVPAVIAVYER